MIFNAGAGRISAEDGNDVKYPIPLPSQDNKLYKEAIISEIASAIDAGYLDITEMPEAIRNLHTAGLIPTNVIIGTAEYTIGPLEAT